VTEIKDLASFRAWLDGQPNAAIAQVLASRAALRAVPFLWRKGKMNTRIFARMLSVALWQNVIVRSQIANQYDLSYPSAVEFAHSIYSVAAVSSREVDAVCGYAAASVDYATTASSVLDDTWNAVRMSAQVARKFPYYIDIMNEFSLEVSRFELEGSQFILNFSQLWSKTPKWWENELKRFVTELTRPEMAKIGWGVWLEWYLPLTRGGISFGLKDRKATENLERRIALGGRDSKFHEEFWDRKPGEINREIAEWVAEARAAEVALSANSFEVDIEIPAQSVDATMFGIDASGKIARLAVPPEQRLLITAQQQKEYQALREDAAELSGRGQILGQVGAEVAALLLALPLDMSHASVFDVWRALNRLRRTMNSHLRVADFSEPHDAKLEPAIAEELNALLRTANIFAFGDLGLLRRDELAIAPQDRPALNVEKMLGDGLAEAAVEMPDMFTDDAFESVAAEELNSVGAGDDPHGLQAIDQTNKTRRNWLAAILAGLKAEQGFAWKEIRGGAYKAIGATGVGVLVTDILGTTAVYSAIWKFVSAQGVNLLNYVKAVYQNPAVTEFVAWALKIVGL
jgi:hypothetical protein